MKRLSTKILSFLCILTFLFSGCTKQEKIDVFTFRERLIALAKTNIFEDSVLLTSKSSDKILITTHWGKEKSLPIFCSLQENEKQEIIALSWLCLPQDMQTEEDLQLFWDAFLLATSVLENKAPKEVEKELESLSIVPSALCFSSVTLQKAQGKWQYTMLCRKESIALFCERYTPSI